MKSAKSIIAKAWHLTLEHRDKLFKLGFVPSFFSILVSAIFIFYQIQSFRDSVIFDDERAHHMIAVILFIWNFISSSTVAFLGSLAVVIVVLLFWFFAPILCSGAIAFYVGQLRRGKPLEGGIVRSLMHFFSLFEMTLLKRGLYPLSFFSEFSFVSRNISLGAGIMIVPVLTFFGVLGMFILFLLAFTTATIILLNKSFAGSIGASTKVVMSNFKTSFMIAMIILLIELRVLLNVLIVFAIPVLIMTIIGLTTAYLNMTATIILALSLGFLATVAAAYLTGILFVFSEVIWALAFLELAGEMEDDFDLGEYKKL